MSRTKLSRTLESEAHQKLLGDILSGQLAPNTKLKVRELSERYEIGATPLREALSRLVPDGLVQLEQNKGFRVASLSLRELVEITEMRQVVEAEAFRRAVENGSDQWEGQVIASLHQLNKAIAAYSATTDDSVRIEFEERHRDYHRILISACGNSRLVQSVETLHQHLIRYRAIFRVTEVSSDELRYMHDELARIAVERDVESAATMMRRHVRVNVDQVKQGLRATPSLSALIEINC
ncbi:GntR family transcriptional regulator [Prosthecomicrobium sp. N25]|uniref:GntR family transcriptional regulator n=1 Tax=Prosthecomicrobium sp. N25 TaxID=3129254 RepID=UPI0030780DC4